MENTVGITETGTDGRVAGSRPAWQYLRSFRVHALLLLLLLLGLAPLIHNDSIAIPDEAVYSAQASYIADGSWSAPRPALDVDKNGLFVPLLDSTVVGDRSVAYSRHISYPLLLSVGWLAAGSFGLMIVSTIATWIAAVAGGMLARRLDPSIAIATLWIIGLGSPLIFDAYVVVAHSAAAALCGVTMLCATRVVDDRSWGFLPLAALGGAAMVLMRTESIVVVAAVAAVVGLSGLSLRPFALNVHRLATGGVIGGVGIAAYVLDTRMAKAVSGSTGYGTDIGNIVSRENTGPIGAIWSSLLRPFDYSWSFAGYVRPMIFVSVILAALSLRLAAKFALLPTALLASAGVLGVVLGFQDPRLINGLFAAFPLLTLGLLMANRRTLATPLAVRLAATSALAGLLLVLTIYKIGGASEWGGRFFHVLIPVITPVAVLSLAQARARLPKVESIVAVASVVVLTGALAIVPLRWNRESRDYYEVITALVSDYTEQAATTADGRRPLLVIANLSSDGTSRFFWDDLDRIDVLGMGGFAGLQLVLRGAELGGRERMVVMSDLPEKLFRSVTKRQKGGFKKWRIVEVRSIPGVTNIYLIEQRS